MLRAAVPLILVHVVVCSVSARSRPDPRCVAKNCPVNTTCRFVKECIGLQSCSLEPQCLETLPEFSHTGVCVMGDPVLVVENQTLQDLTCGTTIPCLNGSYCNTELQDTYSTCCMSDPAPIVQPWSCPENTYTGDDFCLDTCINDGDCRPTEKCCPNGCNVDCLPPCSSKRCPRGTYCQSANMPPCTTPGQCHAPGDCVPCPPVCAIYCQHGNVLDPNGCPTCTCKKGPPAPSVNQPTGSINSANSGSRFGPTWPRSRTGQHPLVSFIPPWLWTIMLFN